MLITSSLIQIRSFDINERNESVPGEISRLRKYQAGMGIFDPHCIHVIQLPDPTKLFEKYGKDLVESFNEDNIKHVNAGLKWDSQLPAWFFSEILSDSRRSMRSPWAKKKERNKNHMNEKVDGSRNDSNV